MKPTKSEIKKYMSGTGKTKAGIIDEIQRLANDQSDPEARPKIMALLWVYRGYDDSNSDIAIDLIDQTLAH